MQTYPIISRGFTVCPNCRVRTSATWVKVPASEEKDPLGPSRYMYSGVFEDRQPERIRMQFACTACQHIAQTIVMSDARFFYKAEPTDGACGATCACRSSDDAAVSTLGKNATMEDPQVGQGDHFDKLSPCVVLLEIVRSCNWSCPTCLAASPKAGGGDVTFIPLDEVKSRIQKLLNKRGYIEILQLSGGEPTLHPQFFDILTWCQENPDIHVVMVNTNGTKLLDANFAEQLKAIANLRKVHIYLKFNGPSTPAQGVLAGGNFHTHELRVLEKLPTTGVSTTLAMTVVHENLCDLWKVALLGMSCPVVKGVNYQPRFGGGRIDGEFSALVDSGHVINHLIHQANGVLDENSIFPLPCGDPNCQHIGWINRKTVTCMVRDMPLAERLPLTSFLADRINYDQEDVHLCGCETTEAGSMHVSMEDALQAFRLSIKPFMTFGGPAHNWSCNRTDRCCTAVMGEDGRLDSFCEFYNGLSDLML